MRCKQADRKGSPRLRHQEGAINRSGRCRNFASILEDLQQNWGRYLMVSFLSVSWPRYPSGYGHELVARVSRVRVLVTLKTHCAEGADAL
ncbi:hypothetical protein TNCV_3958321 [Trichonephila clavipes]|nr:hypothetical protein TNCV_3958321 [Trichonephila clavipes]